MDMQAEIEWKLMDRDSFPNLYREVGELKIEGRKPWRIGSCMNHSALYLFTDIPHPEDGPGKRSSTYVLPVLKSIEPFARTVMAQQLTEFTEALGDACTVEREG